MTDSAGPPLPYEQLVFSGGGIRCFWHGGWIETVTAGRALKPARVIGVSGGALSGAAWLAGRERTLLDVMSEAFSRETSNVTWHDLEGENGLTPHQRVYRSVVEEVLDQAAQARIAEGPAFQVFLGRPPEGALSDLAALLGGSAYELEKRLFARGTSDWSVKFGLTGERIDARAAAKEGRLVDLVAAAATIPPVFSIPDWEGAPVIDGGMVDQTPFPDPDEGRTLVLSTRSYSDLPHASERDFVEPSEPVLDQKIDFTDPAKLEEAWRLGQEDGATWLAAHRGG
ncbi:patatin-like phospholipase family protein [Aestuariibius insulae]|uniref:patatin-like phospholipase family protein n=1 Tax=Aestuariibius insulae TaxID=2058287 RepID=UPI00345ECF46